MKHIFKFTLLLVAFMLAGSAARAEDAIKVPFIHQPYGEQNFANYLAVDANNDGITWVGLDADPFCRAYMGPANDWLISPAVYLKAGVVYVATLNEKQSMVSSGDAPWEFALYLGQEQAPEAMNQTIIAKHDVLGYDIITQTAEFTVAESGNYYFGFHMTTTEHKSGGLGLRYFSVDYKNPEDRDPEDKDPEDKDPYIPAGNGTANSPYNIEDAINMGGSETEAWVTGYIVGWYSGRGILEKTATGSGNCYGTVIASSANETDLNKCVIIYLGSEASTEISDLNVTRYPEIIGRNLRIYGQIGKLDNYCAIRNAQSYEWGTWLKNGREGSISDPWTVRDILSIGRWTSNNKVWVCGYIVGVCSDTDKFDATFEAPFPFNQHCLLIADSPFEKDPAMCQSISCQNNRSLELYHTPNNYGKLLKTKSSGLSYLSQNGNYGADWRIKSATEPDYYLWNNEYDQTLASTYSGSSQSYYDFDGDGILEHSKIFARPLYRHNTVILLSDDEISIKNDDNIYPESVIGRLHDGNIYSLNSQSELLRTTQLSTNEYELKNVPTDLYTYVSAIDYNLDGKTEFIKIKRQAQSGSTSATSYSYTPTGDALVIGADGSLIEETIRVMSPEEYAGLRSELKLSSGGEGIPGMGDMFARDGIVVNAPRFSLMDINGDNIPDYVDSWSGACLLNAGNGQLVRTQLQSNITVRDFNADGLADILYFDQESNQLKIQYQQRDGSAKIVSLNSSATVLKAADIDRDGDVDIIATIISKSGPSYLLVYENKGNETFRKREIYLEATNEDGSTIYPAVIFCADIDADGLYEAVCTNAYAVKIKSISETSEPYKLQLIGDQQLDTSSDKELTSSWEIANLDNSGRFLYHNKNKVVGIVAQPANQRPSAPAKPELSYNDLTGLLTIKWPASTDAETASIDLTYELRVGSAPGLDDVVMAQSLADGRRRVSRPGSNGYGCQAVFRVESWPAGKLYISVQAVDDNYLGSEFSEPAAFEKSTPAIAFNINSPNGQAVHKKIEVSLSSKPEPGYSYSWDFGDGTESVIRNETGSASVIYTTHGRKTIKLTIRNSNGAEFTAERIIDVAPASMSKFATDFSYSIDIDGDGYGEILTSKGFMTENTAGEYELLKKSFNNGLSSFSVIHDFDGDGLADGLIFNSSKSDIAVYHNYGDGDMERQVIQSSDAKWSNYDFNNDGKLDVDYNKLNSGDYISYEDTEVTLSPRKHNVLWIELPNTYYDFNNDGLMDVAYFSHDDDGTDYGAYGPFCIFENIDGIHYKPGQPVESVEHTPTMIDDIDGDGKADFIFCSAGYSFGITHYAEYITIIWGSDAATTTIQCPDGTPFASLDAIFDVNNDGIKDLLVKCNGKDTNYVCYIYPDFSVDIYPTYGGKPDNVFVHRRNGNILLNNLEIEAAHNERPTPPTNMRSTQSGGNVVVEWNPGTDTETPATGLKYNVAVKRKGASGEDAYLISPMNGENATCALPSPIRLLNGPRITIPLTSIPKGEYEVRAQSVDGQMTCSEFSETYILRVTEQSVIDMPTSAMVDSPTQITVRTNAQSATVDFGAGASAQSLGNGKYTVEWSTEGMKDIKVNQTLVGQLYVYPQPAIGFTLPERVLLNAEVVVPASEARFGQWLANNEVMSSDAPAEIVRFSNDSIVVKFKRVGEITVVHSRTETYGTASRSATVIVDATNSHPEIGAVFANSDNHHTIAWSASTTPVGAKAVKIYREGSKYNDYSLIAERPITTSSFTDTESRADVKTGRYKISYVLPYGESAFSEAHQPIHVQINKGVGGAINLSWSQYEGLQIESYRILRGKSATELDVLDVVSGHTSSFSDTKPSVSEPYYAIELVVPTAGQKSAPAMFATEAPAPRSNVVSAADAVDAVLATSVGITTSTGERDVIFGRGATGLQLSAHFMPVNTTVTRVHWEIVGGDNNMTIDHYGNVKASGFGSAIVRASACDGSGVYGEIELWARVPDGFVFVESLGFESDSYDLHPGETLTPKVEVLPVNAEVKTLKWTSLTPNIVQVDANGTISVANGIESGTGYVRVETTDGSNIYHTLIINVVKATIRVTEIIPAQQEYTLRCGESVKIELTILPENATNKTILWSSHDKSMATVTQDGVVTANNLGKTGDVKIGADATDGPGPIADVYTDIVIHIVSDEIKVRTLIVQQNYYAINEGEQIKINTTVLPENATNKVLKWTSLNPAIASVSSDGVVTGLSGGNTTYIRVETTDGSDISFDVEIEVRPGKPQTVKVSDIVCTPDGTITLFEGNGYQVDAYVLPENATVQTLRWTATKPEIATVNGNGMIRGISEGTGEVLISACDDSGVTKTLTVIVNRKSAIESTSTEPVNIAVEGSDVVVRNVPSGQAVRLYTTSGRLLRSEDSIGSELRFRNLNGTVIVVAGTHTRIVAIK